MGLKIRTETRTGDTSVGAPPAPTRPAARHLADDAGADRAALEPPRRARICSPISTRSSSTSCMRCARPSAAICWRSIWRGCASSRRALMTHRPVGNRGAPERAARLSRAQRGRQPVHRAGRCRHIEGGAKPEINILEIGRADAVDGPHRPLRHARNLRRDRAQRLTLVFVNTRMQAELLFQELWRINDDNLPIALHHGSLDAAQRRKVEAAMAAGTLARGRRDLDARPRHRLGRCRSRHPCRRAERREPAFSSASAAPTTASTSHRAASWCRATASRCSSAGPRSRPPRPARKMPCLSRRARSTCSRSTCSAWRAQAPFDPDDAFCGGAIGRALCRAHARQFDRVIEFVSTGGYALKSLRSVREAEAGRRWPVARRQSAHRPAIPLERRHHRRHADDQSPPRSARGGKGASARAAAACWAKSRNVSSSNCASATLRFRRRGVALRRLRETEVFVSRASARKIR